MVNGQVYNLKAVPDSSNYSDGSIVWVTDSKGETGTLEDQSDSANPKTLAKDCRLQSAFPPVGSSPSAVTGAVTGTVSFHSRKALPKDAVLLVQLQDVTHADAPAPTIAEFKTTVGSRRSPIAFKLDFDPAKIDPKHAYALEARIVVDTQLLFVNDTLYPVLTQGHTAKRDLLLKAVSTKPTPSNGI